MSMFSNSDLMTDARTVDIDGRPRTFAVIRDAGVSEAPAVLLLFHGSNQTGRGFRIATGDSFDRLAVGGSTLVVYLDGYKAHWNDARASIDFAARKENIDDVAFTRAVIDDLVATLSVDRGRVFALGYSNGGQMVWRLADEAPELLAGIAFVGASRPAADNLVVKQPRSWPLPALLIHGTKDPLVPYGGGIASLWGFRPRGEVISAQTSAEYVAQRNGFTSAPTIRALGADVELTEYRSAGHLPVSLYTINDGGHTVPGRRTFARMLGRTSHTFETASVVGQFFGLGPAPISG